MNSNLFITIPSYFTSIGANTIEMKNENTGSSNADIWNKKQPIDAVADVPVMFQKPGIGII